MNLTNTDRELIERALDEMWQRIDPGESLALTNLYCQAISIVRERTEGVRKVRRDFGRRRPTPQMEILDASHALP